MMQQMGAEWKIVHQTKCVWGYNEKPAPVVTFETEIKGDFNHRGQSNVFHVNTDMIICPVLEGDR